MCIHKGSMDPHADFRPGFEDCIRSRWVQNSHELQKQAEFDYLLLIYKSFNASNTIIRKIYRVPNNSQ